jgi:hypothetical protein
LEYVVRSNEAQISDPAFVTELSDWIRFNEADARPTCSRIWDILGL